MATASPAEDLLRTVDLFRALPPKALARVAAKTRRVEHPGGKQIVGEGDEAVGFHLLTSGTAEVLVHGEPRDTLSTGQWFGEISLIDGKPRSATVRTTEPVTTLSISSWDFAPLLEDPEVLKAMLQVLCARVRRAEAG